MELCVHSAVHIIICVRNCRGWFLLCDIKHFKAQKMEHKLIDLSKHAVYFPIIRSHDILSVGIFLKVTVSCRWWLSEEESFLRSLLPAN